MGWLAFIEWAEWMNMRPMTIEGAVAEVDTVMRSGPETIYRTDDD